MRRRASGPILVVGGGRDEAAARRRRRLRRERRPARARRRRRARRARASKPPVRSRDAGGDGRRAIPELRGRAVDVDVEPARGRDTRGGRAIRAGRRRTVFVGRARRRARTAASPPTTPMPLRWPGVNRQKPSCAPSVAALLVDDRAGLRLEPVPRRGRSGSRRRRGSTPPGSRRAARRRDPARVGLRARRLLVLLAEREPDALELLRVEAREHVRLVLAARRRRACSRRRPRCSAMRA